MKILYALLFGIIIIFSDAQAMDCSQDLCEDLCVALFDDQDKISDDEYLERVRAVIEKYKDCSPNEFNKALQSRPRKWNSSHLIVQSLLYTILIANVSDWNNSKFEENRFEIVKMLLDTNKIDLNASITKKKKKQKKIAPRETPLEVVKNAWYLINDTDKHQNIRNEIINAIETKMQNKTVKSVTKKVDNSNPVTGKNDNVSGNDNNDGTDLSNLIFYAHLPDSAEKLKTLLATKKIDLNKNILDWWKKDNNTYWSPPLHTLINYGEAEWDEGDPNMMKVLKVLLNSDAIDINKKNYDGNTPLHLAAGADYAHDKFIVKELLKVKDIDIFAENNQGKTALEIAEEIGGEDITALLKEAADKDPLKKSLFHLKRKLKELKEKLSTLQDALKKLQASFIPSS